SIVALAFSKLSFNCVTLRGVQPRDLFLYLYLFFRRAPKSGTAETNPIFFAESTILTGSVNLIGKYGLRIVTETLFIFFCRFLQCRAFVVVVPIQFFH